MSDSGTIDITDIVENMKDTFVLLAVDAEFAGTITTPGLEWLGLPIISNLYKAFLNWQTKKAANLAVMLAFFQATAERKPSQAADYIVLVKAKESLPPTATDEEYLHAEEAECAAFRNFVLLTN